MEYKGPIVEVNIGNRLGSMILDHMIMTGIIMAFAVPFMLFGMIDMFELNHEPANFNIFGGALYGMLLGYAVYFNKDILHGRSLGKRVIKLQVTDNKTGVAASPLQCFVRNMTIFLWPIEVLITLFSPARRLGDFIAGTRISAYIEPEVKPELQKGKMGVALLLGLLWTLLITSPFLYLSTKIGTSLEPVEASYNQTKSDAAEDLLMASFPEELREADFKVWDEIKNDERAYVSGILYFSDRSYYERLSVIEEEFKQVIIGMFPLDGHYCRIRYVTKETTSMSSREIVYDDGR